MIYFTSDTHFGHKRVIEFCKRPWVDVDSMDEGLIRNWNSKISPQDEIYILGDFSFAKPGPTAAIFYRLNGKKKLIVGNHDREYRFIFELPWDEILPYYELKHEKRRYTLCHYPFAVWRDSHKGSINLHGHSHGTYPSSDQQLDVGVDNCNYYPLSIDEVLVKLKSYKPHVHKDSHTTKDKH